MGRWEPGAPHRLAVAALELFAEQGFDRTTAAEIAARAGVTERTFFRHYADKREVLFAGSDTFEETAVAGVRDAAPELGPLQAVGEGFRRVAGTLFADRHEYASARGRVIAGHPSLQERELIKMARLGTALAAALVERGVPEPAASLAAQSGVAVFLVAFARWIAQPVGPDAAPLAALVEESFAELRALNA